MRVWLSFTFWDIIEMDITCNDNLVVEAALAQLLKDNTTELLLEFAINGIEYIVYRPNLDYESVWDSTRVIVTRDGVQIVDEFMRNPRTLTYRIIKL